MLKVRKFYARSFDLDAITIFWEIEDTNKDDDIYGYTFELSKCESPTGPFDLVYGPFKNIFMFRDSVHPENHKNRNIYYRLKITDTRTNETQEWQTGQIPEPDLIALEVIRQEDVLFRTYVGRKCYLFPRKTFGQRCICFNKITQRGQIGNCGTCYGTMYLGGYNTPVSFYAQVDPNARQVQLTQNINHTINITTLRTVSYPPISPGDIIVDSENHRWTAIEVRVSQRLRYDIHQEVTIKEVLKEDIAYAIPVLDEIQKTEEISDRRNFTNPQNITSSKKIDYTGDHPDGIVY